ncbi:MAG: hypothetical protein WCR07_15720 [Verrucomicrobiota bacterium]|jgi:pimeloyl-ACP methyl ester carboxylesterase
MNLPSPVIFVPGIMGSALRDEYPVSPEPVWTVLKAALKSYERITLHPDDLRYEVIEPARVTKDSVFGLFYEEIIEELRHNLSPSPDEPVPVFPFAYDWRQPLANTQELLSDFIEDVVDRTALMKHYHADGYTAERGKVSLVGHSMGGLVIAGLIKKQGMDRVDKVATMASPFQGSIEAIAKTAIGVGGFSIGSGGSREREAARLTPALYHLLPSYPDAVVSKDGSKPDIFVHATWQQGILDTIALFIKRHAAFPDNASQRAVNVLTAILDQAWKHRSSLNRLELPDSRRWLCIVGVGSETRLKVTLQPGSDSRPVFDIEEETNHWTKDKPSDLTGDGTVPFHGARCGFIPEEEVICVCPDDFGIFEFKDRLLLQLGFHSAIPGMNLAHRLVTDHLLGRPARSKGGRPSPLLGQNAWNPPVQGLA